MKLLLTHAYYLNEDPRELLIMKPYVPLGILYIAAFLEEHGYPNQVFDATFSDFNSHCDFLKEHKPEVIGIYTNLMTKVNVLRLISFIKNEPTLNHTKIILGGPEVRNHAPNFIDYGADYIVLGEGEETMLELVQCLHQKNGNENKIAGIAFKINNEIFYTEERKNIRDINTLPFPARKKVDLQLYFDAWKSKHGESAVSVSTMRGCPYTCKWCSRAVYGQSYRRRSPQLVAQELKWIETNYDVDTVWFVDDVFTISHKWLEEFRDALISQNVKIKYECITRADRMNEQVLEVLRDSGCYRVWIGAESGSQKIIDAMDRRVDVNQVREMIRKSKDYGIQSGTFIMVGYPGETESDIIETLHHLKTSDPDLYTITIAYPIKGTPLYTQTEAEFVVKPEWHLGSDRQIDFKRTYRRQYYDYAIRWIANQMSIHRSIKANRGFTDRIKPTIKSIAARTAMTFYKLQS